MPQSRRSEIHGVLLGLSIILAASFISSCEKEPIIDDQPPIDSVPEVCDTTFILNLGSDTIHPSPYLAMYPGSWWAYSDGSVRTADAWVKIAKATTSVVGNCATVIIDSIVVVQTSIGLIAGDCTVVVYPNYKTTAFNLIMSDQLGQTFYTGTVGFSNDHGGYHGTQRTFKEHFDEVTFNGITYNDVRLIETKNWTYFNHTGGGPPPRYTLAHHAYDVGLIALYSHTVPLYYEPAFKSFLVSYHIGPH